MTTTKTNPWLIKASKRIEEQLQLSEFETTCDAEAVHDALTATLTDIMHVLGEDFETILSRARDHHWNESEATLEDGQWITADGALFEE